MAYILPWPVPLLSVSIPGVDMKPRQQFRQWQSPRFGLPQTNTVHGFSGMGFRDKWGPQATPETVAGGAHHLSEAAMFSRVYRGGVFVFWTPKGKKTEASFFGGGQSADKFFALTL